VALVPIVVPVITGVDASAWTLDGTGPLPVGPALSQLTGEPGVASR
jgi:hypothetical protein